MAVDAVAADVRTTEPEATPSLAAAAATPALAAEPVTPAPAVATPVAAVAPAATPYHLPTESLAAIASGAGLQWVNSDAEKIRAVQTAMASEPKPIHVPRQPRPRVVIDDGPLVLVETKKDLSQIRLPFDTGSPPAAP